VPIATIAERVRHGACWRPPLFGIDELPAVWHDDVERRIRDHGFAPYLWPGGTDWPDDVGDAVVFRFGYFDCFTADQLRQLLRWQAGGATFLNPTSFLLDSKVVMAALQLPAVRQQIAANEPAALAVLDRCIPETLVVRPESIAQLQSEQQEWVIKYAGYDRGNQAWGGRSLQIGAWHAPAAWARILRTCLGLPWPVVAQRLVPTALVDIAYIDRHDDRQWMRQGATRLRSFILRDDSATLWGRDPVEICGSHITVSGGRMQVSESTQAVQAPVVFQD
jgi:hypothetical protein